MCVAAAIAGAAVVGAGASIYAGNKAADAAQSAANSSVGEQQREYNQTRTDQAPFRTTGVSALNQLAKLYGLDSTDANGQTVKGSGKADFSLFTQSPDYQFTLGQGQKAIDRSLAARGMALSGAGVREGERYASGLASQDFGQFYNRLAGLSGNGQSATNAIQAAGTNEANNISNAYTNAGNARASAYNDMGQTIGNVANGVGSNYLLSRYLGSSPQPYTVPSDVSGAIARPNPTLNYSLG